MAVIQPVPVEEALRARTSKAPSVRTLRTRAIEQDAVAVIQAVESRGAATIGFAEEDEAERYLARLRAALLRKGATDMLLQKKRGRAEAVAWRMCEEDTARMETRRTTGARLGQFAKQKAAQAKRPSRSH